MRVYKRGETWWIDYNYNGERIRESTGTSSKKRAQQLLAKRMVAIFEDRFNIHDTKGSPRFSDFEATAAHDQARAAAHPGAGSRPLLISLR